ncbi:MAG: hypothetical protein SF052_23330 [Bacteroidia bacterium]|nr:hypothetical protein [Bacteroidia bacterium]
MIPLFLLTGCPAYDPPLQVITIHNYSDSAVYVYSTCEDSLPRVPELKLFETCCHNAIDAQGNKMDTISSPYYRINAYAFGDIIGAGSAANPAIPCEKPPYLRFFFISETTMRTHSWAEIHEKQLYSKKMSFNLSQLDSLGWVIKYVP